MIAVSMSLTSCIGVVIGTLFLDVDEDGELTVGGIDTGLKESEVQEWLGMTEIMLLFTPVDDVTCCVSIGRATEYVNIKIPATHDGKTITRINASGTVALPAL